MPSYLIVCCWGLSLPIQIHDSSLYLYFHYSVSSSISLVWSGWISGFCRMIFDWPESDFRPTQEKGNGFFVKGSVLAVYW